jgi:hypothetical protein
MKYKLKIPKRPRWEVNYEEAELYVQRPEDMKRQKAVLHMGSF